MKIRFDDTEITAATMSPSTLERGSIRKIYAALGRQTLWIGVADGASFPSHDLGPVLIPVQHRGNQAITDGKGRLLVCRPPVYLCPACGWYLKSIRTWDYGDKRDICCVDCGEFGISRSALAVLARNDPLDNLARARFAFGVRQTQRSLANPLIDSDTMKVLLAQPLPDVAAQVSALIEWLRSESQNVPGAQIVIERPGRLAPILGAVGHDGVCFILRSAEEDGLASLRWADESHVVAQLTIKGWRFGKDEPEHSRRPVPAAEQRWAVILTALPVETTAVLPHLSDLGSEVDRGTRFYVGRFGEWNVALAEIGSGNASASSVCTHALLHYSPKVALFVGVAGGLKDVQVGDVVVATKVYRYESGKVVEGGFLVRPDNANAAHAIEQQARYLIQTGTWRTRIPAHTLMRQTQLFVGPIAAGEKVIAATQGEVPELLRQSYGDALAVEMEGRGFLTGAHPHPEVHAGVVRGISDLLSGKAEADATGSQKIAAEGAAAVAFEILDGLQVS